MPFTTLKEVFEPLLPSIVLALFGSAARFCSGKVHTVWELIRGLVVSGFAGAIASLLLVDAPFSLHTKIALGGMAGFAGDWFLNALVKRLVKKVAAVAMPLDGTEQRKVDTEK